MTQKDFDERIKQEMEKTSTKIKNNFFKNPEECYNEALR